MESRIYGSNSVVIWFHQRSFMPLDIQCWTVLTILLAGVLANVYLGLYISEKCRKALDGMRVMICNQVFANLLGLFSHSFLPTHNERLRESGTRMDYLCKIMPSLGFLGVAVSLSNLACICVAYYYNKKNCAVLSRRSACLLVLNLWFIAVLLTAPLTISLDSVEITFNKTTVKMCAIVWQNLRYEEMYMDYVFTFKFLIPLLVIFTVCLKIELLFVQSRKILPAFPNLPAFLVQALAVTCFFLLVYLYPLHNAFREKHSVFGSVTTFTIIRIFELIGLANCSIVPVVLKSCVDEYAKIGDAKKENDYLAVLSKDEDQYTAILPSAVVNFVTYDALTENIVVDKSKSSPKTDGVKVLITL